MQQLNPIQWAILPLKKYATFSGRAPRAEFWWFYLLTVIAGIATQALGEVVGDRDAITTLLDLALLLPSLTVTIRRLHDTDRSAWWLLAPFGAVAFAAAIAAFAAIGEMITGTSGSSPTMFTTVIVTLLCLLGAGVTFLVFMVQPGTQGPNRFGPDPYGPSQLEEVFA